MNYKHWLYGISIVFIALLVSVLSSSAVYAVSVGQDVTLQATDGSNITLLSGSDFDTLTVNSNGFTFDLSGTQSVSLRDGDAQILKTNIDGLQGSCGSGNSEITLPASKGTSITLYIEGFACSSGGGGGGSYTSGGGDSNSSSGTTTQTTTATTTSQSTTQTASSSYLDGAPPPPTDAQLGQAAATPVIGVSTASSFPGVMQIKRGLGLGSEGEDVKALQQALASMSDVYPGGKVTGYYGSLTQAAVAKFQLKYGLVSSASDAGYGYVGPKTRAKLQEVFGGGVVGTPQVSASSPFTREIGLGATGDDVTQLQAYLAADKSLYPEGKVTGYYGSLTVTAVKRFQAKYGITQLGRVGPMTLAKLNELMDSQGGNVVPSTAPSAAETTDNDEAAKAALQNQIQDLQTMINSLTQQIQQAQ